MIEAGMLALLIAVLVASIYVIRKTRSEEEIDIAGDSLAYFTADGTRSKVKKDGH
jgi:hypothetical protein